MRDEIVEIALRQFLKYGIRKITVKKLIEPIGISSKTVYRYFKGKEDLLRHCLLKHYSWLAEQFQEMTSEHENPVVALYGIWDRAIELDFGVNHVFYHDLNYYYPRLQDAVLRKLFRMNIVAVQRLIEKGRKQGLFRQDIVPAVIPEVITILYTSITRTNQLKKYKLSTKTLMQNTIEAYIRGICTEAGLEKLK
jgi:AcrR family transcriptional regulator